MSIIFLLLLVIKEQKIHQGGYGRGKVGPAIGFEWFENLITDLLEIVDKINHGPLSLFFAVTKSGCTTK